MASFAERLDSRRKNFKKVVDSEDTRRKREDETVQLRKAKKDEQMQKRRMTQEEDSENLPRPANTVAGDTGMAALVSQVQTGDEVARMDATVTMRRQLSVAHNPPVQEAINCGAVPLMVALLASPDAKLQFEASWVLTNIASGDSHQTQAVVDSGAVPHFVKLLAASHTLETRDQALWALGNISGDSTKSRDVVLDCEPMKPILELIVEAEQEGKLTILRNAVWALSNLLRGKPPPALNKIASVLPFLARLIYATDMDVLTDTLWALSYVGDGPNERIDALLQTGAVGKVVEFLQCSNSRVVQPALRVIGNVVTGNDTHTAAALESGVLGYMPALLSHTKSTIRKESLWLLSNVAAGTQPQLQKMLETGVLPRVLEIATSDTSEVRKEAVWVLANAAVGGTDEQLKYMADAGAVTTLSKILDNVHDGVALTTSLDAIKSFLKAGESRVNEVGGANPYCSMVEEVGGLSKLEALQEDGCPEVYRKVVEILQTYFDAEEDSADAAVPEIPAGGFNFAL